MMMVVMATLMIALVAGLAIVPAIQEASAATTTSDVRDKGARGELSSEGKRNGKEVPCPTSICG